MPKPNSKHAKIVQLYHALNSGQAKVIQLYREPNSGQAKVVQLYHEPNSGQAKVMQLYHELNSGQAKEAIKFVYCKYSCYHLWIRFFKYFWVTNENCIDTTKI